MGQYTMQKYRKIGNDSTKGKTAKNTGEEEGNFSFYASPLSIIHILGLLVFSYLIDHIINRFLALLIAIFAMKVLSHILFVA